MKSNSQSLDFSYSNRTQFIDQLKSETFDLLIIGGGITGAGIALDAASRGLKTALVEKHDFAFGTSSRSTKLIHGGLRYLKQLEFGLVKEVGSERAVVHRLAPHLVIPEKMLLPLYEKRGLGSTLTSVGLKLYDWLAGVRPEDQRKMLNRNQTLKAEPLLNPLDIKGGALYAEYRTDDARLTIENIKAAFRRGALPINYCEVIDLIYEEGKVKGVRIQDRAEGSQFDMKAHVVVNAAGPWVDELREMNKSKTGKSLHLTKGVHIVVAREKLPIHQSIYFDVGDGRMIFAIPRGRTTYIGTTDTNYTGSKEEVFASKDDVDYLLNAVNNTFESIRLHVQDIESSWAGLRPLIHEEGKSASELSRKDEIFESPTGLISIAGGKLTGYRKMAQRVVDLVIDKAFSHRNLEPCATNKIRLTDSFFSDDQEVSHYTAMTSYDLTPTGVDATMAGYLVHNYGKQTKEIVEMARSMTEPFASALIRSEVRFVVKREMVVYPVDFFVRRTGMVFFNIQRVRDLLETVLDEFRSQQNWSREKIEEERSKVLNLLISLNQFK
jgi:glycerol-3-phosphate dehydrogenase